MSTARSNTPLTSAAVASRGIMLNSSALNSKKARSAVLAYVCLKITCAIIYASANSKEKGASESYIMDPCRLSYLVSVRNKASANIFS